eukprot:1156636-Pelagomonas_calceolata.AAC.8
MAKHDLNGPPPQDLAAANTSLSNKVAELEVALAVASTQGRSGPMPDVGFNVALGGSLADPLGEKAKELRKQRKVALVQEVEVWMQRSIKRRRHSLLNTINLIQSWILLFCTATSCTKRTGGEQHAQTTGQGTAVGSPEQPAVRVQPNEEQC